MIRPRRNFIGVLIVAIMLLLIGFMPFMGFVFGDTSNISHKDTTTASIQPLANPPTYTNHTPIRINNDSGFNITNGVIDGDGSAGNPYIIGGWEINATGNGSGIYVGNTTLYFRIRNCYVHNASGNPAVYYYNTNIVFNNSDNGGVENCTIENAESNGILLISGLPQNFIISNNSVRNNGRNGIYSNQGRFNTFHNNTIYGVPNFYNAILLYNAWQETVTNNSIYNSGIGLNFIYNYQTIENNTVNDKPVYYYKNGNAITVPSVVGQLLLADCTNSVIKDLVISNTSRAITLGFCINVTVENCLLTDNTEAGIYIYGGEKCNITKNTFTSPTRNTMGILGSGGGMNYIMSHNILTNLNAGITLNSFSSDNIINFNEMKSCINAVQLGSTHSIIIANNSMLNNLGIALYIFGCNIGTIANNTVVDSPSHAIFLSSSDSNTIINNIFKECSGYGVSLAANADNNIIHHNEFLNNHNGLTQGNDLPGTNFWNDTGGEGNYWSDYRTKYPYAKNDGHVWDTPYEMDAASDGNDSYPLVNRVFGGISVNRPFRIDDNSGFNLTNGVRSGSGSMIEPYIIDNWAIDGSNYGYCLYIGNTTKHFIVRNCTLHNAGGNSYTYYWNTGLVLYNVTNGTAQNDTIIANTGNGTLIQISNNCTLKKNSNITMNTYEGIFLKDSEHINIVQNNISNNIGVGITIQGSDDNTFINNSINSNQDSGLYISSSSKWNTITGNDIIGNMNNGIRIGSNSDYNTIFENNISNNQFGILIDSGEDNEIIYNTFDSNLKEAVNLTGSSINNWLHHNHFQNNRDSGTGVQCYDDTGNNNWNDTNNRGNYWTDYTTKYPSAANDGFVWDTPYDLNGSAGAKDYHPLAYPIEFQAPSIIDLSGISSTTGEVFSVECSVSDNILVSRVFVKYWYGTDVAGAQNKTMAYNAGSGTWVLEINVPGDSNETLKYIISAVDPSDNWAANNERMVKIIDNDPPTAVAGTDWAIIQGERVEFNASLSTDNLEITSYTWHFIYRGFDLYLTGAVRGFTFFTAGDYLVELRVEDASGNNDTDTLWVNVTDNIIPLFYDVDFPESVLLNEAVNIKINASDLSGIHTLKLNYTDVNGTVYNVTMVQDSYVEWRLMLPGQVLPGIIEFYFWVNDTLGNWNRTENFTIRVLDNILPNILNIKFLSTVEVGEEIIVTTEVDDNIGISAVRLNYTDLGGKVNNMSMQWVQGTNYSYTIPAQTITGTIQFRIWVLDKGNNFVRSALYEIHVIKKHISFEKPEINWLAIPPEVNLGDAIEIMVNVKDAVGVAEVFLNYSSIYGKTQNVTMIDQGGGNYSYSISSQTSAGYVTLYVAAVNTEGVWNSTGLRVIEVKELKDNTPPEVTSVIPENGSVGVKVDVIVKIIFSEGMNTSNVVSALVITPTTEFDLEWLDNNVLLKITFKNNLVYNTTYKLIIGRGATDLTGNQLERLFALYFKTQEEPGTSNDNDNDGMDDAWELSHGLDPTEPNDGNDDPDNDGLTNLQEYQNNTNPKAMDTDGDNIPDDWELLHNLNPGFNDAGKDLDGDFYTNFEEYENNTDPNDDQSMPTPQKPEKGDDDDNLGTLAAILIIIIIILILLLILIRRSRKGKEEEEEEAEEEEEEDEEETEVEEVECPDCGAMVLKGEAECPECGADIEVEELEEEELEQEAEEQAEEPVEDELKDEELEEDVPEEEEPEEKEPIEEEEDEAKADADEFECPDCGAVVPVAASSCPMCGAEFEEDEGVVDNENSD
ncbi:NosD domain-containing protein [[Eubacterium] cellulosolvens]